MMTNHFLSLTTLITTLLLFVHLEPVAAFQGPHAHHQHPLYIRYREEQQQQQQQLQQQLHRGDYIHQHQQLPRHTQMPSHSDILTAQGTAMAMTETNQPSAAVPLIYPEISVKPDLTIATPVSYDEETGMVQTAVRAIVKHPVSSFVEHQLVGLSSTLVIATGALHETVHSVELELAHHNTEGLIILSMGHFFHYGREAIRQLVEYSESKAESKGTNNSHPR